METTATTPSTSGESSPKPRHLKFPYPGFAAATAPDGQTYHVPKFMVPAAELALHTRAVRDRLDVGKDIEGPRQHTNATYVPLGRGTVLSPPDPAISRREALAVHSDIVALQELLGISYKDAAHRIYQARLLKADAQHTLRQSLVVARKHIDEVFTKHLYPEVKRLDEKLFGDAAATPDDRLSEDSM